MPTASEFDQPVTVIEDKIGQIGDSERRIDEGKHYSRQKCLRFLNIKLSPRGEKHGCIDRIEKILSHLDCGVRIDSVDSAHRIGPIKMKGGS